MRALSSARLLAAATIAILLAVPGAAQERNPLQPEDYGRWEQLASQRAPLSPDGRWLVYGVSRVDGTSELRIQPLPDGKPITIAQGEQAAWSDDSKWLATLVGFSEQEAEKLRKERKPLQRSLRIVELATGQITRVDGIESFTFSPDGAHIAMRRYAPEPAAGSSPAPSGPEADDRGRPGTTLVVRNLATGRDLTFGNVGEMAWHSTGARLAFTINTADGVGNGVQLYDAASGSVQVLDSSTSRYAGLTWRDDSPSLAVLRAARRDEREGVSYTALAWPDVTTPGARVELDPTAAGLPADMRVVRFRAPQWSEDGSLLYVGVASWPATPSKDAQNGTRSRRIAASSTNPDELPDVVVWHPTDTTVMAKQKIDARRDRERSMLAAWRVTQGQLVRIADVIGEEASPIRRSSRAVVVDTNKYAMERSIGRVYGDVWTFDIPSGTKQPVATRILDRFVQTSPGGKYLVYVKDSHYWVVDLASGRQTNVTQKVDAQFFDRESDDTSPQKPAFGIAGWTPEDSALLVYDKHDIWEIAPDGSRATRLTNGRAANVRYRYVRLDPEEEWIDRSKPLILSQFGLLSKQSGYARLGTGASPELTSLVTLDKRVDRLTRAKNADRFAYVVQGFDDSPDYFTSGPALGDAAQVTTTNPFMSEYAWGRAELVEYRSAMGTRLQGALYYPAGYQPGRRYPMVVYMYEKLSDGLHTFSVPSERSVYNAAAFTTRGYFYFMPDIVFRPGEPGLSVVESVVPAVQRVVEMGLADPKRVGIVGHSWGGFDSVYLATHTTTFAAAVAGAPITNLISNFGNHHWTSGIAETDHIETGQQRMVVPVYENLDAYIRNSAVFKAHQMTTPLLVMFGENDGTVHWHQGVELYNVARRAGKPVVMLSYAGEDHGLRRRANQIDYHHRIFEWFDHYLKGDPAESWIVEGERFIDREDDLQRRKKPATPSRSGTTAPAAAGSGRF